MKFVKQNLILIVIATILIAFLTYAYNTGATEQTFDFSNKAEQASSKKLAGEVKEQTAEEQPEEQKEQAKQQEPEKPLQETPQDEKQQQAEAPKKKPEVVQLAEQQTTLAPGPIEQETNSDDANNIEVTADAEQENRYFTTNLLDGQTVTESTFYVTLTHLDETLHAEQLDVTVNGERLENYKGELQFEEGENIVTFAVTYAKEDGQLIAAKQQYTITLNTEAVVIFTNLQNQTVDAPKLNFTASAKYQSERVDIVVTVNGKKVAPLAGTAYRAELDEGKNVIVIEATHNGESAKEQYEVVYEEEAALIAFETDLTEHRAAQASYSFFAQATAGDDVIPLSITLNEQARAGDDGQYTVTLKHGLNVIQVTGAYENEKIQKQYRILYNDPTVVQEEKVDEQAPKLVTDLKDGTKVKGDIKTINVWPTTASGERIRGKNVLVKVNGTGISFTWDDSVKTSYKLVLQPGENDVSIKVWDDDGRSVTETFVVHSEQVEDNGVIGQVTMSLETSTLGIKYLIPPTKMDIHKGEKGSFILDQFLRNHGFTYSHTGSMTTGFYLKDISKPGMLNNLSIPDDLWTLVEQNSTRSDRNDYSTNSVGEFDFANGSGWMYSINGDFPNYGFSDAYFLDGDVVRIRYTLHYGKDIGGFEGLGGATDSEWTKQW